MTAAGVQPGFGQGFGHGKLILVGEHAVVHGHPAVATGISTGIAVEARPGTGRLRVAGWGQIGRASCRERV